MKLLLIEDSKRLREITVAGLRKLGYIVDSADNGLDGLKMIRQNDYDVVILDLMLPKLDGLSLLNKVREENNPVCVLILTAKDAVPDRVAGLRTGADDYLSKPFAFDELLARIEAVGRRRGIVKKPEIIIGDLIINTSSHVVQRNDTIITLTPREYAVLEFLARNQNKILSRIQIEDAIYDDRVDPTSNTIESTISLLRKKIDPPNADTSYIITRRGIGYMLAAPCTE